ncbi:hypothetical protein ATE84_1725 [Aquimarina sp. MAR_2010_214]|nr:hypothetical protein ATE84_1725 [Aquimarina sp. MAR_2010_214]
MCSLPVQEIATYGYDYENNRVQTSKTNPDVLFYCLYSSATKCSQIQFEN